jgi:DUF438 domain-containing protein
MELNFLNQLPAFVSEMPFAITVCDMQAKIIFMNDLSAITFEKYGGKSLIGSSLFDCHSPASGEIIRRLLATGDQNIYTIEKNGKKKLIYQSPWYKDNAMAGLVEISLELPEQMPHFVRS